MKALIACEYSGIVREAFTAKGWDATSCDLLPTEIPGKHYQGDVKDILNEDWEAMIAFPPCTDLAVSGAAWFAEKQKSGAQQQSINFFLLLANAPIKHIAIENPVGIMSRHYRTPSQIIHPYYFGDEAQKKTCLWLKNLPLLYHNSAPNLFDLKVTHVGKGEMIKCVRKNGKIELRSKHNQGLPPSADRGKIRSKTFPGIAAAMAEQWTEYILNQKQKAA